MYVQVGMLNSRMAQVVFVAYVSTTERCRREGAQSPQAITAQWPAITQNNVGRLTRVVTELIVVCDTLLSRAVLITSLLVCQRGLYREFSYYSSVSRLLRQAEGSCKQRREARRIGRNTQSIKHESQCIDTYIRYDYNNTRNQVSVKRPIIKQIGGVIASRNSSQFSLSWSVSSANKIGLYDNYFIFLSLSLFHPPSRCLCV